MGLRFTDGPQGRGEIASSQGHCLGADLTGTAGPFEAANDEGHQQPARVLHDTGDHEQDGEGRDVGEDQDESIEEAVNPAAGESGPGPDDDGQDRSDDGGG